MQQGNNIKYSFRYAAGLRILAFPCNQFNGQEPGNAEEICSFADRQKVISSPVHEYIFDYKMLRSVWKKNV